MKTKKLLSVVLTLLIAFSCFSAAVSADGGTALRLWRMEANGGKEITYLNMVCSAWNTSGDDPFKGGNYENYVTVDKVGGNTLGIDGSAAATFRMKSFDNAKKFIAIADTSALATKPGYTYFKSAMIKLNPEHTDDSNKQKTIYPIREAGGKGFISTSDKFKETLDSYDGAAEIPGYDWLAKNAATPKYDINTENWTRVTEAVYRDASQEASKERSGWVVWGKDWGTLQWTGNWEFLIDDYFLLEVPNNDLLAVVKPIVYGAELSSDGQKAVGGKLTASAKYYDVNPMAEPTVSYKWQCSPDEVTWTDIEGAGGTEYTLTEADMTRSVRAVITVSSRNSADEEETDTCFTKAFAVSNEAKVEKVTLDKTFAYEGTVLKATPTIVRGGAVKKTDYTWQISENGTDFSDIEGESGDTYTVKAADINKFVRAGVSVTTDEFGTTEPVYSGAVKVTSQSDEKYLYVDGKSNGDGSIGKPFSTLEQARDAVRDMRGSGVANPVTVYIRGGEYYRDSALELRDQDKDITFAAYPGEKVFITGGKKVDKQYIKKVTDPEILNRLVEPAARERLYQADLSAYYDEIPEIRDWSMGLCGWDEKAFTERLRLVVNGSGLDLARWPNTTEGELKVSNLSGGTKGSAASFSVRGDSGRTQKWSQEGLRDLMVQGHFSSHWTYTLQHVSLNGSTVTTKSAIGENWKEGGEYYFTNILDEIDMPGESYTDTENKIVYFYGYGDMENPEVIAPTSKSAFFSIIRSTNITFRGIDFAHTRSKIFDVYDGHSITIDDCDMSHFMDRNYFYADHSVLKNCYIYGAALVMINWQDFNRKALDPALIVKEDGAENVMENNRCNLGNVVKYYDAPATAVRQSKGMVIRNNNLYNSPHCALGAGTSADMLITKNKIYNNAKWTGDMGAIYWNTNAGLFGREISYNYFENNASSYADGWAQSVFWDDIATGPWVHHNVFNKGTWATSEGGSKMALKSYGGSFALVENNIFVDTPYGAQFQTYYPFGEGHKQTGWWLSLYGKAADGTHGGSYTEANWKSVGAQISDPKNAEKYKGTPWEGFFDVFSIDFYNKNMKDLDRNKDKAALEKLAEENAPSDLNMFKNNVMVGSKSSTAGLEPASANGFEENTFFADMNDAGTLFKDYENGDFSLTADGLSKVKKTAADFENIDMSDIGVQPFERDGKTETVGGAEPEIGNLKIRFKKGYAVPSYEFSDKDGDREGRTAVTWYISNSKNGSFTKLTDGGVYDLPTSGREGKYIRCTVTPYDSKGLDGEAVTSESVFVPAESDIDFSELEAAIDDAEKLLSGAVVGTGDGEYPKSAVDALKSAVDTAKKVTETEGLYQYEVNDAENALRLAISVFETEKISLLEYLMLNDILKDTANWTAFGGDAPEFSDGSMTLKDGSSVSYTGAKYRNKIFTFNVKYDKIKSGESVDNAFLFRLANPNDFIWKNNSGYLLWIKDETLEYQKWTSAQILESYPNTVLDPGKVHTVSVGVYDSSDNSVKYILTVDGEKVIDKVIPTDNLYGNDGYISFYANNCNMTISPVTVDKSALSEAIGNAEGVLKGAVIGTGYGQYPSKTELEKALSGAKAVYDDSLSAQPDVDRNTLVLKNAVAAFLASVSDSGEINADTEIRYDIPRANLTVPGGVSDINLIADKDRELPEISVKSSGSELFVPRGTKVGGRFTLPFIDTAASVSIANAEIKNIYGSESVTGADGLVRIVLKGQGSCRAAYFDGSKYVPINTVIKEDSFEAAKAGLKSVAVRIKVGDDLVIYTDRLTRIVTYVQSSVQPEEPSVTPGGGNGGGVTKPSGNKGTNGFYSGETTNPSISNPFTDMAGHWAAADVLAMNKAGIVSGVSDTLFDPDRNITRAEFAAIIARALKLSDKTADYKDVNGEWFAPYVGACSEAGIISGYDGYFRPNDNITRQEMAVIIVNAYSYLEGKGANGGIDKFTDKAKIADWAKAAVDTASSVGLISGMGDGTFAPNANATRAQAASIVRRLLG